VCVCVHTHRDEAGGGVCYLCVESLRLDDVLVAHFLLQCAVERKHQVAEHDGEGQAHHDGDCAQRLLDAGGDEAGGDGALSDAPKRKQK